MERLGEICRKVVERPVFDVAIFFLILVSVALLCVEVAFPDGTMEHRRVTQAGEWITVVFICELILRFIASKRKRRFFQEYWIDILAVLPLMRALRVFRFLRLLRLLRLFRVATLLTSNSRIFQLLLRKRAAEYLFTAMLVLFATVFGTLGMSHFREKKEGGLEALAQSFWETIFSLVAGEYINTFPPNLGGKLVILFVQFCGLGFFAVLTGTISAVMIEKLREGAVLKRLLMEDLEHHILVCGWNSGVETIIHELQGHPNFKDREIVVIAGIDHLPPLDRLKNPARVRLMTEDFTRAEILLKANVMTADIAIIVSDVSDGRNRQDADARTVLAALTIEKLNPEVHTCAELSNAMNETHLRMGGVNEVILTRDLAGHLLAQAAVHSANVHLLQELLQPTKGNTLMPFPVPQELVGKKFGEVLSTFYNTRGAIPVAVERAGEKVMVNPRDHVLVEGDCLLCVAALD